MTSGALTMATVTLLMTSWPCLGWGFRLLLISTGYLPGLLIHEDLFSAILLERNWIGNVRTLEGENRVTYYRFRVQWVVFFKMNFCLSVSDVNISASRVCYYRYLRLTCQLCITRSVIINRNHFFSRTAGSDWITNMR